MPYTLTAHPQTKINKYATVKIKQFIKRTLSVIEIKQQAGEPDSEILQGAVDHLKKRLELISQLRTQRQEKVLQIRELLKQLQEEA